MSGLKQLSPAKNKDHHTVQTRSDALYFPAREQYLTMFCAFSLHPCPVCLTHPLYIHVFLLWSALTETDLGQS